MRLQVDCQGNIVPHSQVKKLNQIAKSLRCSTRHQVPVIAQVFSRMLNEIMNNALSGMRSCSLRPGRMAKKNANHF